MDLYGALADPVRRQIVELLARGPLKAGQVAAAFSHISRPAVSRHLRLLRDAGLVEAELAGRERIYRMETAALREIEGWILRLRSWDRHLDALETEVHRARRERERPADHEGMDATSAPTSEEQSA